MLLKNAVDIVIENAQKYVGSNQDNLSEWSDMSIRELLFQWASTIKIQLSVMVWYKADLIIISLKKNLFSPWYTCSWKNCWVDVKQQSLTPILHHKELAVKFGRKSYIWICLNGLRPFRCSRIVPIESSDWIRIAWIFVSLKW